MQRAAGVLLLLVIAACSAATEVAPGSTASATAPVPSGTADPYRWLEEIHGPRAIAWVREQNERTRRELASTPEFDRMYGQALAILNSASRVPAVSWRGAFLYNLWKDDQHPRGLYRRTSLAELGTPTPEWQTVIDIDALAAAEGRPWVFKGMTCLPPEDRRCLVSLSDGGGDAVEIREFDTETLEFVSDGFFVPAAKSNVEWIDENSIFVGTDFGPGSLTRSGYPRVVKLWRRGTPLGAARTVYTGGESSVSASADYIRSTRGDITLVSESQTFWKSTRYQVIDGELRRLDLPATAEVEGGIRGRLVVSLTEDWPVAGRVFRAGSVLLADPTRLRGDTTGTINVLIEPTRSEIVANVTVLDEAILVTTLENVRARLYRFTPGERGWDRELIPFPDNGAISVMTTRDDRGEALVLFESFLEPPTLYHVAPGAQPPIRVLSQTPTFDGSRFEVAQHWAVSKDGTRIPYFVVARRDMPLDGSNPVHIFSYGGFRNALTPSYSGSYERHFGAYGKLWLERGGVFVLANIRGGGEFGPAWHSSVLKENHYKIFEDFEAVASDLVTLGITTPERIGIEGRSNGGLLTLATMVRRPELYGAVISGVPLSDMKRYHKLLAGASWMAEYGNPDDPREWAYIGAYSPYQNFSADATYPPIFIYTSTRDDRVHPGHARKSVARLQALGHEVWYYENTEGGHGGSSTNEQLAYRIALSYAHLWRTLGGAEPRNLP